MAFGATQKLLSYRGCRLRLGVIERRGKSLARRQRWLFLYPGWRSARVARQRLPGATVFQPLRGFPNKPLHYAQQVTLRVGSSVGFR